MCPCWVGELSGPQVVCLWCHYCLPSQVTLGLMLCGSEADKANIWLTTISEFLVFVLVKLITADGISVFMSKTADQRIVAEAGWVAADVRQSSPFD